MSEPVQGTLLLALGNALRGDDGVGTAVLEALAAREDLPAGTSLSLGDTMGLLSALLGDRAWRRVVIVDAANLGRPPGEWLRFTPTLAPRAAELQAGTGFWHGAGLAEVLALAEQLGGSLPELVVYAVQPLTLAPSPSLSAPVQRAVLEVCSAIVEELCCEGGADWTTMPEQPGDEWRTQTPCLGF